MNNASRSLPAWLGWTCRLAGSLFVLFALFLAALLVMDRLHHPLHLSVGKLTPYLANDQWAKLLHGFIGEIIGAVVALLLGIGLWTLSFLKKGTETAVTAAPEQPAVPAPVLTAPAKPGRWKFCNILQSDAVARRVWQFEARKGSFVLAREQAQSPGQPLPDSMVGKGWQALWQPGLNVAWLPADKVFLRVAQLPKTDAAETQAMLEFQLEKLSPIPVTQVVWSFHTLPAVGETQSVVLIIVARDVVEEFLGRLESEKFLADYIEVPLLDQLQPAEEGAWIYPSADKKTALVAWWSRGALQSLGYVYLPAGAEAAGMLHDQFAQFLWAGELEGWLKAPPQWHVVAEPAQAAEWQQMFSQALEAPVKVVAPPAVAALAAATTRRVAQGEGAANLLPPEFSTRYNQQFVDRLWLQGLGATLAIYFAGLIIYFAALTVLSHQVSVAEANTADLGNSYTNALQLTARYQVLKDRQDLKFAALDCWRTTAQLLPKGATLNALDFRNGSELMLSGSAPADGVNAINDFNSSMRKADVNGHPLFSNVESLSFHVAANNTIDWSFNCELNHKDEETASE